MIEALRETDLLTLWIGRRLEALIAKDSSLEQWKEHHFAVKAKQKFLEMGSALDWVCLSVLQSDDAWLGKPFEPLQLKERIHSTPKREELTSAIQSEVVNYYSDVYAWAEERFGPHIRKLWNGYSWLSEP